MLELGTLLVLFVVGAAIVAVVAVAGLVFKLFFKLLLLPLVVVGWLLKGILAILTGLVLLAVVGPVALVAGLVMLVPLLVVAGLVWGAVTVLSHA
ncbi:MAG TPA: hypothetical protein ENK19_04485 [Acidobacteria bacterium]|nr:hypothetical protein [Acidobacteriota bacterium]